MLSLPLEWPIYIPMVPTPYLHTKSTMGDASVCTTVTQTRNSRSWRVLQRNCLAFLLAWKPTLTKASRSFVSTNQWKFRFHEHSALLIINNPSKNSCIWSMPLLILTLFINNTSRSGLMPGIFDIIFWNNEPWQAGSLKSIMHKYCTHAYIYIYKSRKASHAFCD